MIFNSLKIAPPFLMVCLLLLIPSFNMANPVDSLSGKPKIKKPVSKLHQFIQEFEKQNQSKFSLKEQKQFRIFPSLEIPSTTAAYFVDEDPEFINNKIRDLIKPTAKQDSLLKKANKLIDQIKKHQKFIKKITGQEVIDFPIGMKKNLTKNSDVTIGIMNAKMHKDYAEVDVFAKVTFNEMKTVLFFGGMGVKLSHKGGIYGEAKLALLADVPIPISNGQWLVTFKGDFDQNKGTGGDSTYIKIDCEGRVTELVVEADVRISKKIAVPVDEDGNYTHPAQLEPNTDKSPIGDESYVGASFRFQTEAFTDLLVEVDLPKMEFKAMKGWNFQLQNAVLDLSDTKNAQTNIPFPTIYKEQQLLVPGQEELWRGFYAQRVEISLPPSFKKKDSSKRIQFGAENLIIDNFGVSGLFYGKNLLNLNNGDANKWQFSLDKLGVDVQVNTFVGASFEGEIVLPISKKPKTVGTENTTTTSTAVVSKEEYKQLKKKKTKGALAYKGFISKEQFLVNVSITEQVSFDVFGAKARLSEGSYVELKVKDNKFYPKADLSGSLQWKNVDNEDGSSGNKKDLEGGLVFQNIVIQTGEKPMLQVAYMGLNDTIATPKMAGFELGIYDVELTTTDTKAKLGFNVYVNLDKSGIHGDAGLNIHAKLEDGDFLKWKLDRIQVTEITVDVVRKSFEFYGKIAFFEEDPHYGKGLAGNLRLKSEKIGFEMEAKGIFGNVDGLRYWYIDAFGKPLKKSKSNFSIRELGGGLYHHMKRNGFEDNGPSMSGIKYTPSTEVGLGFKAMVSFDMKSGATFTGIAALEVSFNSKKHGGGISRLGFYGGAALMKESSEKPMGDLKEKQKEKAKKEKTDPKIADIVLDKEGIKYFAEKMFQESLSGEETFAAQVGIDFDFTNSEYWGMLDVFLNMGTIKGAGEKNRLGYLEFFDSPEDWYIYVGTPKNRFGLKDIPIGTMKARVNFYFMTGTILPDPALPPANVIDILNLKGDELAFNRNFDQSLAKGVGYAFGGEFAVSMDFDWKVIYAYVEAGVGFDIFIRDFGEAQCKGKSGKVGMDGWYATGQLYAYLQGELGVKVKIFGSKKRIRILEAGLAVLAQAQLPNPWFVKGYAGVKVRVLGIITVRARLKVVIGEPCELINKAGVGDLVVIADINPGDKDTNVDVFNNVQVAFNVLVEKPIRVEEDSGPKTYKVNLETFEVLDEGNKLEGKLSWNQTKDILEFESVDVLPPEKQLTVNVSVLFEEQVGGSWKPVMVEGKPVRETKSVSFTTGKAPTNVPLKNILHMYPIVDQKYMLPKESKTGYVQLKKGQDYLFGEQGLEEALFFTDEEGNRFKSKFSYNKGANTLHFDIPDKMKTSALYTYQLVSYKAQGDGAVSLDSIIKEASEDEATLTSAKIKGKSSNKAFFKRLHFSFHTSKHTTFAKKINSIRGIKHLYAVDGAADVAMLSISANTFEPFGINDIKGTRFTRNIPLITGEGVLDDRYFKNEINPLIYQNYPLDGDIIVDRNMEEWGFPPKKHITVDHAYETYTVGNQNTNYTQTFFPFEWRLAYAYKRDFLDIQYKIVNRYLGEKQIDKTKYERYKYIIDAVFPFINVEKYKVRLTYKLPNQNQGNSKEILYKNVF